MTNYDTNIKYNGLYISKIARGIKMAHNTVKSNYKKLEERLNKFPQGAAPTETLYKILNVLMTEEEAGLMALLPLKPFSVRTAARAWKIEEVKAHKILDRLASRALLLDVDNEGKQIYMLPPPMAGFFEFSIMRTRNDIDQKLLSELFYKYITVEDDFITDLIGVGETQLGRTFVNEFALSEENALHVLDYERASEVIKTASHIGVGMCYCRHKMDHIGKACDAPMDICMTFNSVAESLTKHGYAREIDEQECLDLLHKAYDYNLVQFGENQQKDVSFICNCCSCCCEAMIGARKFGFQQAVHTTNFLPVIVEDKCSGCGKCVDVCPVEAISLVSSHEPNSKKRLVKLDERVCLGCGLCVKVCQTKAIYLKSRDKRVITPVDSVHRIVLMAIERGKVQNLIFDNQAYLNHRIMASILSVILRLPPVKQILASKQMKSKYILKIIERYNNKHA